MADQMEVDPPAAQPDAMETDAKKKAKEGKKRFEVKKVGICLRVVSQGRALEGWKEGGTRDSGRDAARQLGTRR